METSQVSTLLRRARQIAGFTQEQVARRMGMHREYVVVLESGRRSQPTVRTLMRYAKAIGWKPYEILALADECDVTECSHGGATFKEWRGGKWVEVAE